MALARSAGVDAGTLATGWPPVTAAVLVAGVVTDGATVLDGEPELVAAVLDGESELFSSFGSWIASNTASSTSIPTSKSFLRRSASPAATRRPAICVSRVLISSPSGRHPPRSKS